MLILKKLIIFFLHNIKTKNNIIFLVFVFALPAEAFSAGGFFVFYLYLKASNGFNFEARIAGQTPVRMPTILEKPIINRINQVGV